jgi:hypothetical protein
MKKKSPVLDSEGATPSQAYVRGLKKKRLGVSTDSRRKMTAAEVAAGAQFVAPAGAVFPATRDDCKAGPRPCPWVRCKFHLYLVVEPPAIRYLHPQKDPWELKETCVLDVADRGGLTLEESGEIMNCTRERVRQFEVSGLKKLKVLLKKNEGEK